MSTRRPGELSPEDVRALETALDAMGPSRLSAAAREPVMPVDETADRSLREQLQSRVVASQNQAERRLPPVERLALWEERRQRHLKQREAEAREEAVRECTFRPVIHEYTADKYELETDSQVRVEERLARHAQRSAEKHRRLVAQAEAVAAAECTFVPEIHASPIPAHNRSAPSVSSAGIPPYEADGVKVFEYVPVEERTTQARLHHLLASDWHEREDPECTFRPVISPTADIVYEVSRPNESAMGVYERLYNRSIASVAMGRASPPPSTHNRSVPDEELPGSLAAELDGLRALVGARLGDDVMTFYRNVLNADDPVPIREALDHSSSQDGSEERQNEPADDSADVRFVRFNDFIRRQNALEVRRRRAIDRVRFETEGPFKPSMCEQSRLLAKEARARGQNTSRSARRPADQASYTFVPSLSKAGSIHNRRGTSDMAKDAARIEAHRQQLRDDKDRAESKLLTFKPALEPPPKAYSKIVSVLSQRNLPNLHKRLKAKEAQRESVRTQAQEKRDEKERAACTFRPVLNGVPVYVADMARSAQVLRGALIV
jgi:hypothetical protein